MNKKDLVNAFVEKLASNDVKVTKKDAALYVDALFETVGQALVDGQRVAISGFGIYEVVDRAARTGRNPQTGETIKIKAAVAPKFKAGAALKNKVNSKPVKKAKKK